MKKFSILFCALLLSNLAFASAAADKKVIDLKSRNVDISLLRDTFEKLKEDVAYVQEECRHAARQDKELLKRCNDGERFLNQYISDMDANAVNKKFDTALFEKYCGLWETYQKFISVIYAEYVEASRVKSEYLEQHLEELKGIIALHVQSLASITVLVGAEKPVADKQK